MALFGYQVSKVAPKDTSIKGTFQSTCSELSDAISNHNVGETTSKIQQLIMQYYQDVQAQSTESFRSAKKVALLGFALFAVTIAYLIFTDLMPHIHQNWFTATKEGLGIGTIGLISGSVVELIAGTQFYLYRNSAKQFGAFHICLERTHRYLLAYTMAEQIGAHAKDRTLEKIVCIMANAPMITHQDIEYAGTGSSARLTDPPEAYEPTVPLSQHAAT